MEKNSSFLQLNSEKGFLIFDFKKNYPDIKCVGLETSDYAIDNSIIEIKKNILKVENYTKLNFKEDSFDFILAIGVIYALTITDLLKCIKEIQRVGKKHYISVKSYRNDDELFNLQCWALTCESFFSKSEWIWIMKKSGFTGKFEFIYFE